MAGTDDPENVTLAPNDSEYFYWAANVIFAYQRYLSDNDKSADIAIVELDKPLDFSEKINAICLAREFREALGEVRECCLLFFFVGLLGSVGPKRRGGPEAQPHNVPNKPSGGDDLRRGFYSERLVGTTLMLANVSRTCWEVRAWARRCSGSQYLSEKDTRRRLPSPTLIDSSGT